MNTIPLLLKQLLLIASIFILAGSLIPIYRLIGQLPHGSLRIKWYILAGLIIVFIAGYINYCLVFWCDFSGIIDTIVPVVFFLGSVFVLLVALLSLQTAQDVRLISRLEHETITDPLMGIHNRRFFDRRLREEVGRANRYELTLSMLMLDIDHFKNINDTYGHQIGDVVLVGLAKLLKAIVREMDVLTRFGGEEIAIITPQTSIQAALGLAQRIKTALENTILVYGIDYGLKQDISITVSIGIAGIDENTSDPERLIKNADEALYTAKKNGRNQAVVFSGSVSTDNTNDTQKM